MKRYLEAGKIVNTHGVKGEVKIQPWADSAEFLLGFELLYIDGKPVRLLSGRVHKQNLIAVLDGIEDVAAAMRVKGKTVYIDRNEAKLPKGSFFIQDIIGAEVRDEKGNILGKLADVLDMPAGNVYVVQGEKQMLIPAVPEFIVSTDADEGIIIARPIEGM